MADPAPRTRNWRAIENAHKPKGLHVLVFGEVEVSATNKAPLLTYKPERDPKNLGLHLTIGAGSSEAAQIMVWKPAFFHKVVKANEFNHVIVRWNIDQIANFPIYDDREHAANAAGAMKELNKRHAGKKGPKPAGKKPAAKKAAAKKAAPKKKSAAKKKAGGSVKSKKAKKSAPKKAAKKSGLKKLVRRLVKTFTPAKKKKRR